MKLPLLPITLAYAVGIVAARAIAPPLTPLFVVTLVIGLGALYASRHRVWLLPIFVLMVGGTNLTRQMTPLSPHDLRVITNTNATLATIRGRLSEPLKERVTVDDGEESWRTTAVLRAREIKLPNKTWRPAYGKVNILVPERLPKEYFTGRFAEVRGVLKRPPRSRMPGLFDYRDHLRWRRTFRQLVTYGEHDWRIWARSNTSAPTPPAPTPPAPTPPWAKRFQVWAKQALAEGLPKESEELRLLYAMTLGWRSVLTGEVAEPFMRSGTMHIFAISGLHVALLTSIAIVVLQFVGLSRSMAGFTVLPLLWAYTMAVGWQASATRAALMISVILLGRILLRPSNLLNSLLGAGLALLLWQPTQLFHVGFQLSFAVVLSIALFLPRLKPIFRRWWAADRLVPHKLIPRWQRCVIAGGEWLTTSLATSLAATLGAGGLVAYYFNLITPVCLLANLAIVPLSALALMSTMGSWLSALLLPGVNELFNHTAWIAMHGMICISHWAAELPGAFFYVPSPSLPMLGAYYLALIGLISGFFLRTWLRTLVTIGLTAGIVLVGKALPSQSEDLKMTILPVRGGHSVWIDAPGEKNDFLIDCGNEHAVDGVLKPYLRKQGRDIIPKFVATHGDVRHMGGATKLESTFTIEAFVTGQATSRSSSYRQWLKRLRKSPEQWRRVATGDNVSGWRVLHPSRRSTFSRGDDNSLVFYREIHGKRILLLSDLGQPGQNALMSEYPDLRADIVIAGLPRQGKPMRRLLLDQLQPRLIIVCSSLFPATNRAAETLRKRLRQRGIPVFFTEKTGGLVLEGSPTRWRLQSGNGVLLDSLKPDS